MADCLAVLALKFRSEMIMLMLLMLLMLPMLLIVADDVNDGVGGMRLAVEGWDKAVRTRLQMKVDTVLLA